MDTMPIGKQLLAKADLLDGEGRYAEAHQLRLFVNGDTDNSGAVIVWMFPAVTVFLAGLIAIVLVVANAWAH